MTQPEYSHWRCRLPVPAAGCACQWQPCRGRAFVPLPRLTLKTIHQTNMIAADHARTRSRGSGFHAPALQLLERAPAVPSRESRDDHRRSTLVAGFLHLASNVGSQWARRFCILRFHELCCFDAEPKTALGTLSHEPKIFTFSSCNCMSFIRQKLHRRYVSPSTRSTDLIHRPARGAFTRAHTISDLCAPARRIPLCHPMR